jgi:hypothetical protein
MKKSKLERSIVVSLFIIVLIAFSFAQRDSKRLEQLYISVAEVGKQALAKLNN